MQQSESPNSTSSKRDAKAAEKKEDRITKATTTGAIVENRRSSGAVQTEQVSDVGAILETDQSKNPMQSRVSVEHNSVASTGRQDSGGLLRNTFLIQNKTQSGAASNQMMMLRPAQTQQLQVKMQLQSITMNSETSLNKRDAIISSAASGDLNAVAVVANTSLHQQQSNSLLSEEAKLANSTKQTTSSCRISFVNLYVQLPNETMSELVREYPGSFFDKSKFNRNLENDRKAEEELNLTLHATSLLQNNASMKQTWMNGRHGHDSILSSNPSATADFRNQPPKPTAASPYGNPIVSQKSGGSMPGSILRNHSTKQPSSSQMMETKEYFFKLDDAIVFLKRQGYPIDGTNVSYYSSIFSAFVNCDVDPVGDFVHISEKDLEVIDGTLSLRLRFDKGVSQSFKANEEDSSDHDDDNENNSVHHNNNNNNNDIATTKGNRTSRVRSTLTNDSRSERVMNSSQVMNHNNVGSMYDRPKTKERTVAYVIQKVMQWRRLYNGYYDKDFNHQRLSLEDAADQVGVSKKSLDDYLSQLRSGRQCGYDFNTFKNEKVGHLRKYVKDHMDQIGGGANSSATKNKTF